MPDASEVVAAIRQALFKVESSVLCAGCRQPWTDDHRHEPTEDELIPTCYPQHVKTHRHDWGAVEAVVAAALAAEREACAQLIERRQWEASLPAEWGDEMTALPRSAPGARARRGREGRQG